MAKTSRGQQPTVQRQAAAPPASGGMQTTEIRASVTSSPFPDPDLIQRYEDVLPGGADRVFTLIEVQSAHRQQLERSNLRWATIRSFGGLIAGFIIALVGLIISGKVIIDGQAVAGTILGSGDLLALVSLFVFGQRGLREEREQKQQIMTQQLPQHTRRR